MGTTWFFAQYSPNTSSLLPHQKLMATLLMLNKDRGCPPQWEILSIKPTQSTDGFCWLVPLAAWGHVWSVTDTILSWQTNTELQVVGFQNVRVSRLSPTLQRTFAHCYFVCVCIHPYYFSLTKITSFMRPWCSHSCQWESEMVPLENDLAGSIRNFKK